MKISYDKKKYHLYRMSFFIDLARRKKKKKPRRPIMFRQRHFGRVFLKKIRQDVASVLPYKSLRHRKRSKLFSALFRDSRHYTNTDYHSFL